MATRTITRSRPWLLDRPIRGLVRGIAFTGKELHEVIRQPRLLLGLVIGPFLILLAFGSGFKGQLVQQPTVLVIPPDSGLSTNAADYKDAFQFPFTLAGVVSTPEEAQRLFDARQASVIVALPSDVYQRIRAGQHPLIDMRFNELEPVRANYLRFYSYVQTNELNRRVLIAVVNQAKSQNAETAGPPLTGYAGQVQAGMDLYSQRVRSKDTTGADAALRALQAQTANNQSDVRTRVQLLNGIAGYFNAPTNGQAAPPDQQAAAVDQSLANVQTVIRNLQTTLPQQIGAGQPDTRATGDAVTNARNAEDGAKSLQLPPADVLVAPFQAEVTNEARVLPNFITYYAPAVLALLLQHVSISLTALTLVRERTSGATELFRISPSAAPEIVFGKFLGYATVAAVAGAILAVLLRFALKVPIFGSVSQFAGVLALLIAASLGFGLVVSALARSESQAVQYGMLILLASVFFGNFFLAIDTLYPWARVISYALPITYGVRALQDIMLRGQSVNLRDIAALAAFAVGLFILGTILFRREIRRA